MPFASPRPRHFTRDIVTVATLWLLAVLILGLAYQTRFPLSIRVGGDDLLYSFGYLHGFYPTQTADVGVYRFTDGAGQIDLWATGRQLPLQVSLDLNAWRPDRVGQVVISINNKDARQVANTGWKVHRRVVTDSRLLDSERLLVGLRSDTFVPNQYDPANQVKTPLGVAVESLELTPESASNANTGFPITTPAWGFVALVGLLASGAYLASVALGARRRLASGLAIFIILLFSVIVAFYRISLQAYFVPIAAGAVGLVLTWSMVQAPGRRRLLTILLASCVMLLALVPRLSVFSNLPLDGDEHIYVPAGAHYSEAILSGDWSEIVHFQGNAEHPIFVKLLYGSAMAASRWFDGAWSDLESARAVSVAASMLLVALLTSFNPMGAALLAIHSIEIKYSSEAYLEAIPALTAALAVIAFERSRSDDTPARSDTLPALLRGRRDKRWLYVSAVLLGITAASKYIYAIAGFAIALFLIWEYRRRPVYILLYGLIAFGVFFLADPILWPDPIRRLLASLAFHEQASQSEFVLSYNRPWWWQVTFLSRLAEWNPGIPYFSPDTFTFFAGFLGLVSLARRSKVYLAWFCAALLFLLLWSTKWEQYSLTLITPLSMSAGYGLTDALAWIGGKIRLLSAR
jgi:hypothetical protein